MMKKSFVMTWLLITMMAFPVAIASANGELLPSTIAIGAASDGHGDEDEADAHGDEGEEVDDTHTDDAVVDDSHVDDAAAHMDEEVADGHVVDDGHHDAAFSWASLVPLFTGIGVATIASGTGWGLFKKDLTSLQLIVITLAMVTGVLHVMLGIAGDRLLLLNGLGYLGLLGLLYLPIGFPHKLKNMLRILLVGYTLVTIAGYFYQHSFAQFDALAISSKVVEVALVIALAMRIARVQNAEA